MGMVANIILPTVGLVALITVVGFFVGKLFKEAEKEDQEVDEYDYNDTGLDDRYHRINVCIRNLCWNLLRKRKKGRV